MKACLEHWEFLSQKVASLHANDIIGSLMMLLRNYNNHPRFWSFIGLKHGDQSCVDMP